MKKTVVQGSLLALFVLASSLSFSWASKKSDPPKGGGPQMVDAGSFGVYQKGRRVATESFHVEQSPDSSTTTSEFKLDNGSSSQTSELLLSPMGELRKYSWHEEKSGLAQATVTPDEKGSCDVGSQTACILTEHIVDGAQKPHDIPFILPLSTSVLDDYFFIHRELLLWKYIASSCASLADCKLSKTSVGVINPHQQTSYSVTLEFVGMEKVTIRGAEQQLRRFNLVAEDGSWALWMNDQLKLVRIVIIGEDTEIMRD